MSLVTSSTNPLTGLGWPVSRETSTPDVSRETDPAQPGGSAKPPLSGSLTGLGWPREDDRMPAPDGPGGSAKPPLSGLPR